MLPHCASALPAAQWEQIPHFSDVEAPYGRFLTGPLYKIEKHLMQDSWEELQQGGCCLLPLEPISINL